MGVEAVRVDAPFSTAGLVRVDSVATPPGAVAGAAGARASYRGYALDPALLASRRALNEVLRAGGSVVFSEAPIAVSLPTGELAWPAGTPVVTGLRDLDARAARWAEQWGVNAWGLAQLPGGRTLDHLRVALYKPWTASVDEGWTRWLFERWDVPFENLHDAEIRAGNLASLRRASSSPTSATTSSSTASTRRRARRSSPAGSASRAWRPPRLRGGRRHPPAPRLLQRARHAGPRRARHGLQALQDAGDPQRWYAPGSLLRVEWDPRQSRRPGNAGQRRRLLRATPPSSRCPPATPTCG